MFPIQSECASQALSIQELEAKLYEEVDRNGELQKLFDEKTVMCHHIEVVFPANCNIIWFHCILACFCKQKRAYIHIYVVVFISGNRR